MKKLLVMMMLLFVTLTAVADVDKGKRYYMKSFKQKFKMSGMDFVQLHTQAQWRALFADQGRGFIAEFSQRFPKQAKYLHDPKTWQKLQHVGDFAITYASDSGRVPSCSDVGAVEKPLDLEVKEQSRESFF